MPQIPQRLFHTEYSNKKKTILFFSAKIFNIMQTSDMYSICKRLWWCFKCHCPFLAWLQPCLWWKVFTQLQNVFNLNKQIEVEMDLLCTTQTIKLNTLITKYLGDWFIWTSSISNNFWTSLMNLLQKCTKLEHMFTHVHLWTNVGMNGFQYK